MHSRRRFIRDASLFVGSSAFSATIGLSDTLADPIIDVHQHVNYAGRQDQELVAHQRRLGIGISVLMPSGDRGSGHPGGSGEHDAVIALSRQYTREFVFFANENPSLPEARKSFERQLRRGAIGIGEQKFRVDCDGSEMVLVAEVAREYDVPVLMHFTHGLYNRHFERFHHLLERFPTVRFIGHSGAWWANIGTDYIAGRDSPSGPVIAGGLTDRYLADYPNCFGELSGESGFRAIVRDEAHYREFMNRHHDKLLFGSDCDDRVGRMPLCTGARTIAAVRRVASSREIERKVLYENARRVLKLQAHK